MDQQSETQLAQNKDREPEGRAVHAELDRELPGPTYPLLKKRHATPSQKVLCRIDVAEPDDFKRRRLDGRTIFTSTLRSMSASSGYRSSDTCKYSIPKSDGEHPIRIGSF
eukprot:4083443-Amphidinium_carterae.1